MKITQSTVTKLLLSDLNSLDPVTVIMEDFATGQGKLTVDCYGKAWTAYWGAMGDHKIAEFINTAEIDYLANKLTTVPCRITDYDAISKKIGVDVDRDSLAFYVDALVSAYGPEWYMDLPATTNPEYSYLCRIVSAVKDAVKLSSAKAA
jgi:hypothetical protein